MNPFKTLQIPEARRYCIRQTRVPTCFLPDGPRTTLDRDGATLVDLLVDSDRIAAIEPPGEAASADVPTIDLGSRHLWPTLIDMHAHLDKGHIVNRTENPDGSLSDARVELVISNEGLRTFGAVRRWIAPPGMYQRPSYELRDSDLTSWPPRGPPRLPNWCEPIVQPTRSQGPGRYVLAAPMRRVQDVGRPTDKVHLFIACPGGLC
jgi:hypothetical protein